MNRFGVCFADEFIGFDKMPILAFSFSYLKQNVLQTWGLNRLITPKTLYLCGFALDYYNATPTKNPHSQEWEFLFLFLYYIYNFYRFIFYLKRYFKICKKPFINSFWVILIRRSYILTKTIYCYFSFFFRYN